MADETQAEQSPDEVIQDSPMPSEEQQDLVTDNDEQVADESQEALAQETDNELPADVSKRTSEQFEKLRTQLRDERTRREAIESSYRGYQPESIQTPIIDPDTGLLDENALTAVQYEAQQARLEAQAIRNELQRERADRENRETYEVHPDLNPDVTKTFNKKLHIATRQIMLDSMLNPQDYENRQLSFREAADLAKGTTTAAQARQEGAKEALEQLTPKEQASLEASGSASRQRIVAGAQELESLRVQSRRGDPDAVIARLKALDQTK